MRNRLEEIKAKGFDIVKGSFQQRAPETSAYTPTNFGKIQVGLKTLDDATLQLGDFRKANPRLADKGYILKCIHDNNLIAMREASDFYYKTSGIYSRVIRYLAGMYRYDWYVTPYIADKKMSNEKIMEPFTKCLNVLDKFHVKRIFGEIALKVLRHGAYYGYRVDNANGIVLQELPVNYCRSRYGLATMGNKPAVEFNMKYFNDCFSSEEQRLRIVKMFPKEFEKGYKLYKAGKLKPDYPGDDSGWYLLDPKMTVKFSLNGEDYPPFISAIPLIIDLDAAQDLDKKRTMQKLLKIVIQKMPLDKNGELIFDVEEAQQLHNNAVQMLSRAIGVDVLTTFADVDVESLSDSSESTASTSDLDRVVEQVYNDLGVSQLQFNTDGSAALDKSIKNDAATMYNLLLQFEDFLNELIVNFNNKKIEFRAQMLTTTIYNYQELAKLYKEQMQVGFSKMLPQIALGQSQSSILSNAYFENEILNLINVFIPPLMSSTMNENILDRAQNNKGGLSSDSDSGAGRPSKESQGETVTEKTIQNQESQK